MLSSYKGTRMFDLQSSSILAMKSLLFVHQDNIQKRATTRLSMLDAGDPEYVLVKERLAVTLTNWSISCIQYLRDWQRKQSWNHTTNIWTIYVMHSTIAMTSKFSNCCSMELCSGRKPCQCQALQCAKVSYLLSNISSILQILGIRFQGTGVCLC